MNRLNSAGRTLGVAILAALSLAGCASGSTPVADNSPITLTLATFNKFGYSDVMLAQYHTLHPNVTVVQNIAATSQAAQDNMFAKLAAGSGRGEENRHRLVRLSRRNIPGPRQPVLELLRAERWHCDRDHESGCKSSLY